MSELTGKQKSFIDAYLSNGFNATDAARQAGYEGSENTLSSVGYENLRKPDIASIILERMNESAMSANEVLARLSKHARGRLVDLLNEDGQFDLTLAEKRDVADLLKKLKVRTTTRRTKDGEEIEDVTYEYEIHDPQAALVHLGKFHRLFADKQEISGPDGGAIDLRVIYEDKKTLQSDE